MRTLCDTYHEELETRQRSILDISVGGLRASNEADKSHLEIVYTFLLHLFFFYLVFACTWLL